MVPDETRHDPDYDDSDLTPEEMFEMAKRAFDDADNAGPIPVNPSAASPTSRH
jgi:hypothetical protein